MNEDVGILSEYYQNKYNRVTGRCLKVHLKINSGLFPKCPNRKKLLLNQINKKKKKKKERKENLVTSHRDARKLF